MEQIGGDFGDPIAFGGMWKDEDGFLYFLPTGKDDYPRYFQECGGKMEVYKLHKSSLDAENIEEEDRKKAASPIGHTGRWEDLDLDLRYECMFRYFGSDYLGTDSTWMTPIEIEEKFMPDSYRYRNEAGTKPVAVP